MLPRVDSILLLSRLMVVFAVGVLLFQNELNLQGTILLSILSGTFLFQLILFWILIKQGKYDLKKAYLVIIIFELIYIPVLIYYTGGIESNFYLFYCLTVIFSAYMLTSRVATFISSFISASYIILVYDDLQVTNIVHVLVRIGLIWFLSLTLSFVFDYIRRSEGRLLKLFDTLNKRTSELERSQAHLELIYENTRVLAGILDVDEVIAEVMRITGKLMNYPASGILLKGPGGNFIYRGRDIDGQPNFHLKAADSESNALILRVAKQTESVTVKDIGERDDYQPQRSNTEELTITDELTGVYNYRYFAEKLKEEQRRAARYDLPLSLIMLDIDWFKKFNDTYGHEVGNIVLKGITNVVKKCIRDVDILCRYGGEEFVVILPQTPQIEVTPIGERIRQQIYEANFGSGENISQLKVTVSVGISSFPENGKPYDELLSITDNALYRAKGSGKNKVCVI